MKNKCEICRCLLFEADVWSALPESNQLFPRSFFVSSPSAPNIVQEFMKTPGVVGDCRTIGHHSLFPATRLQGNSRWIFFRLLSCLAKVTADAGRGPTRHNIVWGQDLNATLPAMGEVVVSWEGAREIRLWSADGAVWPRALSFPHRSLTDGGGEDLWGCRAAV